jgi:hypothetical protein
MMQDQKLLTLHWRSFLASSSDMDVGPFAHKGGQHCHSTLMLSRSSVIIQDARRETGDVPLPVISGLAQRACHLPNYVLSWPITPVWIDVTMQPCDWRKDQSKIVDAPLTLPLETYQQSFGGHSFCLKVIPSLLIANTPGLSRIMCFTKHPGLSVSEPPVFMSSLW